MKLNKCKECGGDIIVIETDNAGKTRAVCKRCGRVGKAANMSSPRLAALACQQANEMRELIRTLASESWNEENPQ